MTTAIRIETWYQGPTGFGQGGWSAGKFAEQVGESVTIRFRRPIPLETTLTVAATDSGWTCGDRDGVVMEADPWIPDVPDTPPVTVADAVAARSRFPFSDRDHPGPDCFSCGIGADGMHVHPGPLREEGPGRPERYATDWTAPAWAPVGGDQVDPGVVWAALDCASGLYVNAYPRVRFAMTASFAVDVIRPVSPGETLALVGWHGDGLPDWDGRKRASASAAFDSEGALVARSRSFWVAPE